MSDAKAKDMNGTSADPVFREQRPRLVRLAYRMLGSMADAEDIVQDAYLRWLAMDKAAVRNPAALLRTIVTHLCLNEMKSARRRRETYAGAWLPDPIIEPAEPQSVDSLTLPLMMVLERLSPLERAAFLLHDVFGISFDEVAPMIGREPAACRQLASRARKHIDAARPRYPVTRQRGMEVAAAFFAASRSGDLAGLRSLLADEVTAYADGGGKVPASPRPLKGIDEVMARHADLARGFTDRPSLLVRYAVIDGLPGFITIEEGGIVQTTALQIDGDRIVAIYVTRNPDKLRHLGEILPTRGPGSDLPRQ